MQEPGFGPYSHATNTSWLTPLEEHFPQNHPRGPPYIFGPGYSQVGLGLNKAFAG